MENFKNEFVLDGKVQKGVKLFDEVASFNISAITGEYLLPDETRCNRYTYIRVVFVGKITEYVKETIKTGNLVRLIGKLDSEQYVAKTGKVVYNKVLRVSDVKRLKYNKSTKEYEED